MITDVAAVRRASTASQGMWPRTLRGSSAIRGSAKAPLSPATDRSIHPRHDTCHVDSINVVGGVVEHGCLSAADRVDVLGVVAGVSSLRLGPFSDALHRPLDK